MIDPNLYICVALWVFFGAQHSLLARPVTKRFIQKTFGMTFERNLYPLLYFISQCIVFLAVYDLIKHLKPGYVVYEAPPKAEFVIYFMNKLFNLFLIITVFHFDIGKFTGVDQLIQLLSLKKISHEKNKKPAELNSAYLYRYIRHPMYLGILLVFLTSTTIYTDIFFLNLFCILAYIEIGSHFEEKSLVKQFGKQYAGYQNKTKKYIPGLR